MDELKFEWDENKIPSTKRNTKFRLKKPKVSFMIPMHF